MHRQWEGEVENAAALWDRWKFKSIFSRFILLNRVWISLDAVRFWLWAEIQEWTRSPLPVGPHYSIWYFEVSLSPVTQKCQILNLHLWSKFNHIYTCSVNLLELETVGRPQVTFGNAAPFALFPCWNLFEIASSILPTVSLEDNMIFLLCVVLKLHSSWGVSHW